MTPTIQKVILERFPHSISVPTKNVEDPSSCWAVCFSIQPMQAMIHTAVWYMYREEKIQSHIYRYTVQVPYSIWILNICMGLYFLFPVRDASSQVDSTHNVVFIVERIYRKWSLYENPTYWIFFYPSGYYSNGIFRTWSLWVLATWSFPLDIPAYCSWDFQNLDLSGILAVVFTDNYFGYWLDVFLRKSVNFFGFWLDIIFMEFPYCGFSLDDFYCGFILGSGFSIGLPPNRYYA